MEQWMYSQLYDEAIRILHKANEKFNCGKVIAEISDNEYDFGDLLLLLNKTACAMGRILRKE